MYTQSKWEIEASEEQLGKSHLSSFRVRFTPVINVAIPRQHFVLGASHFFIMSRRIFAKRSFLSSGNWTWLKYHQQLMLDNVNEIYFKCCYGNNQSFITRFGAYDWWWNGYFSRKNLCGKSLHDIIKVTTAEVISSVTSAEMISSKLEQWRKSVSRNVVIRHWFATDKDFRVLLKDDTVHTEMNFVAWWWHVSKRQMHCS